MEQIIAKLLQDFEQGKMSRRQLIQSLALTATVSSVGASSASAAPAAESKGVVQAVAFNHVSYQVKDYTKVRDFYAGLFGMQVSQEDGTQCRLSFGNNILIPRNRLSGTPIVDHIAYTIANWDTNKNVREAFAAEIKRRGIKERPPQPPRPGAVRRRSDEVTARSQQGAPGFHIIDPEGFIVQVGGKNQ